MALRKFIIERDIPKVGSFEREQLQGAAAKSNEVLRSSDPTSSGRRAMSPTTRHSASTWRRTRRSFASTPRSAAFPATKITEVKKMIDPTTAA